ncbi:MAG: SsrA-binding protein SmpB [Sedimentisphaeraceae bacterium JB056]
MAKENDKKSWPRIKNKKAWHNYEILDKFEAGISLQGSEVKSLRLGNADLNASYAKIMRNECYLVGCKIEQYKQASYNNHITDRDRKLLLHSAQIRKLISKLDQRGYALIPLALYFNDRGLVKVELALARGKKLYDKRDTLRKKDQARDLQRSLKNW